MNQSKIIILVFSALVLLAFAIGIFVDVSGNALFADSSLSDNSAGESFVEASDSEVSNTDDNAGTGKALAETSSTDRSANNGENAPLVDPYFRFTRAELIDSAREVLGELSTAIPDHALILAEIERSPQAFLRYLREMYEREEQVFYALLDKEHAISSDFVPRDLQNLSDYPDLVLSRDNHMLTGETITALRRMNAAATSESIDLLVSSAYRSYEYQAGLFRYYVDRDGLEAAERVSARAGTSQHQLGTTVDFGSLTRDFAVQPAGLWLAERAWEFGFSLSYPEGYEDRTGYDFEPWHYRYLGITALRLQREYFLDIQQYMLLFYDRFYEILAQNIAEY